MSFFEPLPPPSVYEPPELRPCEVWEPPDFTLPGTVAHQFLLLRTATAAVSVGSFLAYPHGFRFTVHVRLRPGAATSGASGTGNQGGRDLADRFAPLHRAEGGRDGFRFGLLFADGRRVTSSAAHSYRPDAEPGAIRLSSEGGNSSSHTWDSRHWVHPLPPVGPLTFFATWPDQDVDEVSVAMDAALIRAAADDAEELWPEVDVLTDDQHVNHASIFFYVPDPVPSPDPDPVPDPDPAG